jgi:hypothetical protein
MNVHTFEQAQFGFFTRGKEFFESVSANKIQQWFTLLTGQLGAVEVALKKRNAERITELVYARGADLAEITGTVGRHLLEGWQPYGGLTVVHQDGNDTYFQAMMKTSGRSK